MMRLVKDGRKRGSPGGGRETDMQGCLAASHCMPSQAGRDGQTGGNGRERARVRAG